MALEYVLHSRYHGGTSNRGSSTYGNKKGSLCAPCCNGRLEEPYTSETIDASRQLSAFGYFDSRPNIYMPGSAGLTDSETANFNKQAVNRVVNFRNKVYNLVGSGIFSWNDSTSLWETELELTGKNPTQTYSIGLYPVFDGRPIMVTAWTDGTNWRYAELDGLTGEWTISASTTINNFTINDSNGGIMTEVQHNNRIYFLTVDVDDIYYFDYSAKGFGSIKFPTSTNRHPMDICVYNNELYSISKDTSENINIWRIYEDPGKQIEFVTRFTRSPSEVGGEDFYQALSFPNNYEGRPLLYVDNVTNDDARNNPTLMAYYIISGFSAKTGSVNGTNHGWGARMYKPVGTGLSDISQATGFDADPLRMMANQAGEDSGEDPRPETKGEGCVLRCHVNQYTRFRGDEDTHAGMTAISVSSRFGMYCSNSLGWPGGGDGNTYFQHIASTSGALNFTSFQKEGRHRAFPHERVGGGGRHSVVDNNGNPIVNLVYRGMSATPQDGITRISYELQTTDAHPNGTPVNIRFFYDTNGHAPESQCTLVGASEGVVGPAGGPSGNIIWDVIADSGIVRTVDWDAKTDGVPSAARINIMGMVAVTGIDGAAVVALDSPADLPGLALWLDADDVSTIGSGTAIYHWADKSGAAATTGVIQNVPADQPSILWGDQNGRHGIDFDGTSDYLFANTAPIDEHPATIFCVFKNNSTGGPQYVFSISNDDIERSDSNPASGTPLYTHDHISFYTTNTDLTVESQDTARESGSVPSRTVTHSGSVAVGTTNFLAWQDYEFRSSSRVDTGALLDSDFTTDGEVFASGLGNTTVGRFTGAQLTGTYNDAGSYADVTVYEIAIYSGIIGSTDIARFRAYAENKWGI